MHLPNHVVIIEGGDGPRPSCFFTCQKIVIIVLNAIAAIGVAFALAIFFLGILYFPDRLLLFVFFLLQLVFIYLYCGIYGPLKEDESLFGVHLGATVFSTLLQTFYAIVLLITTNLQGAADERSSSSSSSSENHCHMGYSYWEMKELGPRYTAESVLPSMVASIAWTAFLLVFGRNLRRWNRQKMTTTTTTSPAAGWSSGRQTTTSPC